MRAGEERFHREEQKQNWLDFFFSLWLPELIKFFGLPTSQSSPEGLTGAAGVQAPPTGRLREDFLSTSHRQASHSGCLELRVETEHLTDALSLSWWRNRDCQSFRKLPLQSTNGEFFSNCNKHGLPVGGSQPKKCRLGRL